jgi:hypothetical protein
MFIEDYEEEDAYGDIRQVRQSADVKSNCLPLQGNESPHSAEELAQVELLKLLKDMRAPLYAYDTMMQWAANAVSKGHVFWHHFRSRDCLLEDLIERHKMEGLHPIIVPVLLGSGVQVEVVAFNFKEMIWSLFSDPQLMQQKNFDVTVSELLNPPTNPDNDDFIQSFLDTSSYQSAYR